MMALQKTISTDLISKFGLTEENYYYIHRRRLKFPWFLKVRDLVIKKSQIRIGEYSPPIMIKQELEPFLVNAMILGMN
jgi:hypothetical protein